jgi:RNA polymerase primary sigma factor
VSQKTISADAPIRADEHTSLMETLPDKNSPSPDASLMDTALKLEIKTVLSTLPYREMEIMVLYFGLNNQHPLTLEEIGVRFSITRERVRQIKEHATRQLRKSRRLDRLKSYLG